MDKFNFADHSHCRYNPLKDEWVLVSPHRMKRPWSGQIENVAASEEVPKFDPKNPLCPGVVRPSGDVNPEYTSTYVFDNDFPALQKEVPTPLSEDSPFFRTQAATGVCRVICYHPKSNITLPIMTIDEIESVITTWQRQYEELEKKYKWIQIFENKGAIMGCSNPHPHGQIWASSYLPNEARIKDRTQLEYYRKYNRTMLLDYVKEELKTRERVVIENQDWLVVVPFWAVWPFETMILPKTHIKRITDIQEGKRLSLAEIMKYLTVRYDNLFKCPFPYTMGWHGAPSGNLREEETTHWVFHGIFYPPLLRSATIKKFMVGYELLAQAQRDLTPEDAAQQLREQSDVHYLFFR